ncbi:MAG: chorismate mutase [Pseudomonadota bacterium]
MTDPLTAGGAGNTVDESAHDPTDETARAAVVLAGLRHSIDNLDAILVHTLAERFKCTQEVGRLKAAHALPPADPVREARQIERLERMCADSGLDPDFARKVMRFIVDEVIRHHQSIRKDRT